LLWELHGLRRSRTWEAHIWECCWAHLHRAGKWAKLRHPGSEG
jgi:hypothetical protein